MRIVGIITTTVLAVAAAGVVVAGVQNASDVKRYLRMRAM